MVEKAGSVALRMMRDSDVPEVVAIQEPASVVGLASVFPQDEFPFPRQDVARRWREEIAEAGTDCFVVLEDETVVGFAAIRGDEFLHFGIAIERWGSGIARQAHDALVDAIRDRMVSRAWLRVSPGTPVAVRSTRGSAGAPPGNAPAAPSPRIPNSSGTNSRSSGEWLSKSFPIAKFGQRSSDWWPTRCAKR